MKEEALKLADELDALHQYVPSEAPAMIRRLVEELGKQGAVVVGSATTQNGADQISAALKEAGIKGCGLALDVNSSEQIQAVLKTIAEQFGEVSILVNNAGITKDARLVNMTEEQFDAVIDVNLKGV